MILPKPQDLASIGTWNRRYREMQELLHQGPEARSVIVEALNILKDDKDLSFGERKMLDHALNYEKFKAEQDAKVAKVNELLRMRM